MNNGYYCEGRIPVVPGKNHLLDNMNPITTIDKLLAASYAREQACDMGTAYQLAQEALAQAQALQQPAYTAAALNRAAMVQFRLGHYKEARDLAGQALALSEAGSPTRPGALLLLGNCAAETDSLDDAVAFYWQAIDLAREVGDQEVRMTALHNLSAAIYLPRGQFDLALAADEQACQVARAHDLPERLYLPLITMAWVHQMTGQPLEARAVLVELARFSQPGSIAEGYHHYLTACLALDEGDLANVPALCTQARAIAEASGEPGLNIEVRLAMSRYHRLAGRAADARVWADDALSIATRTGYQHLQGKSLLERARAAWQAADLLEAGADLRAALDMMQPLRTDFDLARAQLLLAALLHAQRRGKAETKAVWLAAAARIAGGGYAFLLEQERALAFPLAAAFLNDPQAKALSAILLDHFRRVPAAPLRIYVLGRLEVWQGTHLIDGRSLGQRRAGELLGLLLISPAHSLPREQVMEALWPDQVPEEGQVRLHHASSALRHALEPDLPDKFPSRYLDIASGHVTLCLPAGSTIDAESFEQCVREGRWAEAVALYQGDLLPAAPYADWAILARESLAQLFLRALLEVAQAHLAAGCAQEALAACRRALAREPWQEQAVMIGMRACMTLGDRAGALRLYRKLTAALERDLGAVPQADLLALYHSLTGARKS